MTYKCNILLGKIIKVNVINGTVTLKTTAPFVNDIPDMEAVFVEIDGKSHEYTLAPGEKLVIDCGYLAAMEPTVTFDIETVKGLKNIAFGGEGLFLGNLTGPGKVWLQTLPVTGIARVLGEGSKQS